MLMVRACLSSTRRRRATPYPRPKPPAARHSVVMRALTPFTHGRHSVVTRALTPFTQTQESHPFLVLIPIAAHRCISRRRLQAQASP